MFRSAKWYDETEMLREIALSCGLNEEMKWAKPCFTLDNGKNIVLIQGFKETCALMFFNGVLLPDPKGLLTAPGANSRVTRWIKFTSLEEIARLKRTLKAYIFESIEIHKKGAKVNLKASTEIELPKELEARLNKDPRLKKAFRALTPGRQRAYSIFISQAKQTVTREARVEKFVPRILAGKGMNDD
jgi:uncharacterized protein YdeI (YjbR/CyaY-like superfamily)